MKSIHRRFLTAGIIAGLAFAIRAAAQDFDEASPPPPEAPDLAEPPGPPPGEAGPVDRWMERLEKRNPDEYLRYREMREKDPEGFRRELAGRLGRERLQTVMNAHPRLRVFLDSLPESERMDVLQALGRALRPGGPPHEPNAGELRPLHEEVARLAREYRQSTDQAQREQRRADLKLKLGELFDAREQGRADHIARIQAEVAKLQQALDSRRAQRDEIVERRLQELTADESSKW
ncbi:MAG TPA: hypothetical protein P5567_06540 [Kiritimatiellia bacterium]|nr:hypothetical protein [Kiritimatiellia bacterium]HRZ12095.1 hypothetical protein [Kiritimatiellia bacterium]HSA18147.1 hypothetical protein [Kiritimatiellia bacterium]